MSALQADLSAAAWAIGFALGGALVGAVIDQYVFPMIVKAFGKEHFSLKPLLLVSLDIALGIVLLGSLVKYVLPVGMESPIGESVLIFFFFMAQPHLVNATANVVAQLVHPGKKNVLPPVESKQRVSPSAPNSGTATVPAPASNSAAPDPRSRGVYAAEYQMANELRAPSFGRR